MKRYKQTAIWLFSFSNPLTRIQLWQIPGASNTISAKSADVMINCEGHVHNGWSRPPAGLPFRAFLISIPPWGLKQIWAQPKKGGPMISTFQRWILHFRWRFAVEQPALIHRIAWLYGLLHGVQYSRPLALRMPSTMHIAMNRSEYTCSSLVSPCFFPVQGHTSFVLYIQTQLDKRSLAPGSPMESLHSCCVVALCIIEGLFLEAPSLLSVSAFGVSDLKCYQSQ